MQKDKFKNMLIMIYVGLTTFLISCNSVYADTIIDCQNGETMKLIRELFGYVKIAIPVILIVMGSIDFVKAVVASDDQKMKKAQKDFVTRLIVGVAIFFVPSILEFLLSLIEIETCIVH